ncbi:UdgX family uracil-DNA binding protein [Afifella sp. JA880]|uniref:UdgX family uracil-DNA binding protein n=1 Tax=Afifella sp. JA880 TaxID=2975280 RepID=UPI0021BA6B18|nr:UdgX family uracil-DNA binding protein [Afifella sp. JA880]MCT8267608.1 UdgX family uracil-DNA binding protein [Afifella sp. JA880]
MTRVRIDMKAGADLDGFRRALRILVRDRVAPDDVVFAAERAQDLFGAPLAGEAPPVVLPRAVTGLIADVVCHRENERYGRLYRLVWRILKGERGLLEVASDPLVYRLARMQQEVRRDIHHMHGFLRFRRVVTEGGVAAGETESSGIEEKERFVAYFEPAHFTLAAAAPFFAERFANMAWSILTPDGSLHWDGKKLVEGPPARRDPAAAGDGFEEGWRTYYAATFNPARANPKLMAQHMPRRYWADMPEVAAIPELVSFAPARVREMIAREAAASPKRAPEKALQKMREGRPKSLQDLNALIAASEPLVSGAVPGATRAVLGEGPLDADIVFVGEQPGDQEDRQGRPFVGPAGQLLDRAMAEAGIERGSVYLTNAVKHFKFEMRGKRRIHQKPTVSEVKHYRWWLMAELEFLSPRLVVALGGTAALALSGRQVSVTKMRGRQEFPPFAGFLTVHPSYLLRLPDAEAKASAYRAFVDDLRQVREIVDERREAA